MTNDEQESKRAAVRHSSMSAIYGMALLYGGGNPFIVDRGGEPPLPVKPCLFCGKPKQHNNAFCSAECCRAWRSKPNKSES